MWAVAFAAAVVDRGVGDLALELRARGVAFVAKRLPFGDEHLLVRRPVGIVTAGALALGHRAVDRGPLSHVVVALVAQGRPFLDEHELLLVLVVEVAGGAVPRRRRLVGERERLHLG